MKKLFITIISVIGLLIPIGAFAAIAFVNSANVGNNAAATTATTTLNVTVNNLLVVSCTHGTTFVAPISATDTIGNTFSAMNTASNSTQGAITDYWAISSGTNANDIIGCNFASSVGGRAILASQYSGIATTNPLDQNVANETTTSLTTFSAGPFTTTNANEVIVGAGAVAGGGQGIGIGTGYIMAASTTYGASGASGMEYQIVSSIQSGVSSTITNPISGSAWSFVVGTFQAPLSNTVQTSSDVSIMDAVTVKDGVTVR